MNNLTVFENFKKYTGYDIESYFNMYIEFTNTYYPMIVNYYNGSDINQNSFIFFDALKNESKTVESLIDRSSNRFNTTEYWDFVDLISDIQNSIFKVDSLARWLRSSRTDRFSSNIKISYIQKQNQSIEAISRSFGFNNEDDWVNLSIQNQISEEEYTNKGGKFLKASFVNNQSFDLENIVDTLSETNIYGKDIAVKMEFDNSDIRVLQGKESLQQTFSTIMSTIAGSIPEFEGDGIPDYLFGTNQNIIQYPILFRSLMSMFQKDKRFSSFEILNIKKEQDAIMIETQVKSITGEIFVENIQL